MKASIRVGFSFGLTSAIITTLGLMIGLYSSIGTKLAVIGGILTIAIADAFSDSLGIHISQESNKGNTTRSVWESTIATWATKFLFGITFLVPVILLELKTAIFVSIIWGLLVLSYLSYNLGEKKTYKRIQAVAEHLTIAIIVIIITHYVGLAIPLVFG